MKGSPSSNTAKEMAQKYPVAAAYLKAESYSNSRNYIKASFGREALEKIKRGKNAKSAIKDMERKWNKHV